MKSLLLILSILLCLSACSRSTVQISETAGVGRQWLANLSDLASVYGVPFPDAGDNNDWFFAKTTRDPATGVVTYVWERSRDTLALPEQYGAVYRGDESRKVCCLTFCFAEEMNL